MKKTAIALAIAGLAAASVAQAAPQENTFYAGARVGWSAMHHGLGKFEELANSEGYGLNRNSVTYGVFGGYQILNQNNFGLAAELGYDFFGKTRSTAGDAGALGYHAAHGASLALKPSYEVYPDLDVYGKVGVALVRNMYKAENNTDGGDAQKFNKTKASLILGAGVEYAILPELAARLEYQWLSKAGNLDSALENAGINGTDARYSPDIHSVTAGLSYRFGQGAAPVAAPEVVNKTFTLNSDVTFAFGKSTLKPEASTTLDGIYSEIAQVSNPAVAVNGYADRIGKDASNLKLSQRRAETVANYLVSKGVNSNSITATGYGEANPVTGNTCDSVKGRKALIACLAPDRRVEVQVQGNKQATM
ncbi:porin OmpA [Bisgaard Taxon 10/6]|uniref:Outer membrane protein A n=1 Tax=Exercitatus varius TaxID=67857 RepID=A0AAW6Q9X3_9PAST|nr:porin OmpA [Exercitatus varius]MDG2914684.1 porin OmpA [Exercitatus varius]MDG2939255.1 porin OmpA [Exercitatus varius]MDG2945179.1 porin OmpA [Exercitatus varius]MDG2949266.1 porin OmpA [Exercitatus varius]